MTALTLILGSVQVDYITPHSMSSYLVQAEWVYGTLTVGSFRLFFGEVTVHTTFPHAEPDDGVHHAV